MPLIGGMKLESLSFGYKRLGSDYKSWNFTLYASNPKSFLLQFLNHVTTASDNGLTSMARTFEPKFQEALQTSESTLKPAYKLHIILVERTLKRNTDQEKAKRG
jgi:hypothetical protein